MNVDGVRCHGAGIPQGCWRLSEGDLCHGGLEIECLVWQLW